MISSTLGAPLGGTTLGGQPGLESDALRLILPAKGGGGFGMYLPSMVVVALGEPGVPVVWTCARAEGEAATKAAANIPLRRMYWFGFIVVSFRVSLAGCLLHQLDFTQPPVHRGTPGAPPA
jgi:hypothetical protein